MKQKDKFYSSLLVALVAGFIYYQFADVETIKNLPRLAYKMFTATVEPQNTSTIAINAPESAIKTNKDNQIKQNDTDIHDVNTDTDKQADFVLRIADQSTPVNLSSVFRNNKAMNVNIPDFVPKVYAFDRGLPEHSGIQDFGVNVNLGEDYMNYVSFGDNFMHDSNKINMIVKLKKLDSINIFIDIAMDKLNESMEKLNKELAEKDFSKMAPQIDKADIEIDMSEFNEGMKEFEESMKDFKFDMKDFEEGMKELRRNMDRLKENMKELQKNQIKKYKIKVEEVES